LGCAAAATQVAGVQPALALNEDQIGQAVYNDLRDSGELLFDSPFYEHLNEVGEIIAATVGKRYPSQIRFYIVKGDSANAFSVPGGNIYVNEPLLRLAKNRDELGGVLGHEAGHMVEHHVAKHMNKINAMSTIAQIGTILTSIVVPGVGGVLASSAADYGAQLAMAGEDANISRHIESEADHVGADIVAQTGVLNPWGMVWFFEVMTKTYGPGGSYWLRSHPLDATRIAGLKEHFQKNPQLFGKFQDTEALDDVYW
jgi:predicted Zn-dependent protease